MAENVTPEEELALPQVPELTEPQKARAAQQYQMAGQEAPVREEAGYPIDPRFLDELLEEADVLHQEELAEWLGAYINEYSNQVRSFDESEIFPLTTLPSTELVNPLEANIADGVLYQNNLTAVNSVHDNLLFNLESSKIAKEGFTRYVKTLNPDYTDALIEQAFETLEDPSTAFENYEKDVALTEYILPDLKTDATAREETLRQKIKHETPREREARLAKEEEKRAETRGIISGEQNRKLVNAGLLYSGGMVGIAHGERVGGVPSGIIGEVLEEEPAELLNSHEIFTVTLGVERNLAAAAQAFNNIESSALQIFHNTKLKNLATPSKEGLPSRWEKLYGAWVEGAETEMFDKVMEAVDEGQVSGVVKANDSTIQSFMDISLADMTVRNLLGHSGIVDIALQFPEMELNNDNRMFSQIADVMSGARGDVMYDIAAEMGVGLRGSFENAMFSARVHDIRSYGYYGGRGAPEEKGLGKKVTEVPEGVTRYGDLGKIPSLQAFEGFLETEVSTLQNLRGSQVSESFALRGYGSGEGGTTPTMTPFMFKGKERQEGFASAVEAVFPKGWGGYDFGVSKKDEEDPLTKLLGKRKAKRTGFKGIIYKRRQ